jgi:hypothetical protein
MSRPAPRSTAKEHTQACVADPEGAVEASSTSNARVLRIVKILRLLRLFRILKLAKLVL